MGVVYRAEHAELGQKVALKVLTSDVLGTKTAVDCFLREARTTASLGHPNIVRVQDLGTLDDGRPFLVMELLSGEGLDDFLARERKVAPERAVPILKQAAAALDAIHSLGMVHRDVKPENLFLARHMDGSETVKLVDFGLVGMSRPDFDEKRLTQTGLIYGTPPYMAPETMAEKTPSPKWDVYALAVVLYELLTGRIPLEGGTPLEYLTRRAMEDPPRLDETGSGLFSEEVEKVVRRGLNRFADARYDTAGELAAAFGAAVDGEAPQAQGGGTLPIPLDRRHDTETAARDGDPRPSVATPIPLHVGADPPQGDDGVDLPLNSRRVGLAAGAFVVLLGGRDGRLAGIVSGRPCVGDRRRLRRRRCARCSHRRRGPRRRKGGGVWDAHRQRRRGRGRRCRGRGRRRFADSRGGRTPEFTAFPFLHPRDARSGSARGRRRRPRKAGQPRIDDRKRGERTRSLSAADTSRPPQGSLLARPRGERRATGSAGRSPERVSPLPDARARSAGCFRGATEGRSAGALTTGLRVDASDHPAEHLDGQTTRPQTR